MAREKVVEKTPDKVCLIRATDPGGATIAVTRSDDVGDEGPRTTVQRVATWSASSSAPAPSWDQVRASLAEAAGAGFDGLLAEHRAAWARRWERAGVCIEGNPEDELAARFAVFHLLGAAPDAGEAAVGPRGLTGAAYRTVIVDAGSGDPFRLFPPGAWRDPCQTAYANPGPIVKTRH